MSFPNDSTDGIESLVVDECRPTACAESDSGQDGVRDGNTPSRVYGLVERPRCSGQLLFLGSRHGLKDRYYRGIGMICYQMEERRELGRRLKSG